MPQAVDEAGNIWEVDAQGKPVRFVGRQGAAAPQPMTIGQPNTAKAQREAAAEARAQQDQDLQFQKFRMDQQKAPSEIAKAQADAAKAQADAEEAKFRREHGGLSPSDIAARQKELTDRQRALAPLVEQINRTQELFNAGPGATAPWTVSALRDYMPNDANKRFDTAGAQLSQIGLGAFRVPGTGTVSDRDAMMFDRGNLPQASNFDASNDEILRGMRNRVEQEYQAMGLPAPQWTGIQQDNRQGAVTMAPGQMGGPNGGPGGGNPIPGGNGPTPQGGLSAGDRFSTPADLAAAAAIEKAYRSGASLEQIVGAAQAQGYQLSPQDVAQISQAIKARQMGKPAPSVIPRQSGQRNQVSQALGSALLNPAGTALATGLSGSSFGTLDALAPDTMAGLRALNPTSALAGDIGGAIAGSGAIGKLGAKAAEKVAPQLLRGGEAAQFARQVATDATYGGLNGGITQGDPLTGAAAGAIGSVGGQLVGKGIGKAIGGLGRTAAAQALRDAGIPMTIGQQLGGMAKGVEDRLSGVPFVGDIVNSRRLEGLRAFNQRLMNQGVEPVGGNVSEIGENGLAQMRDQIGNAYDSATQGVTVPLDAQFGADMQQVARAGQMLPADYAAKFDKLGENRIAPIVDAGQMTGDTFQQAMRGLKGSRASAAGAAPGFEQEYRDAVTKAMGALRSQMDRGGGSQVISGLAKADQAYRSLKTLQDAVQAAKNGTGSGEIQVFTPAQANTAATRAANKYGGPRQFADLIDAAQATLPNKIPDSGTAGRLALLALPSALGGAGAGVGYASGDTAQGSQLGLALGALLAAGGTKGGQKLLERGLLDRPESLAKIGREVRKRSGLFGTAAVPLLLEGSN